MSTVMELLFLLPKMASGDYIQVTCNNYICITDGCVQEEVHVMICYQKQEEHQNISSY